MAQQIRTWRGFTASAIGIGLVAGAVGAVQGQSAPAPVNDAPNPYTTVENHFKLPEGRTWGSTSAVDIDKDGKSIWVAERCGANSLLGSRQERRCRRCRSSSSSTSPASWSRASARASRSSRTASTSTATATSGSPTARTTCRAARPGSRADAPLPPTPAKVVGHQVFKFSPDGKLLLTLGKPGGNQPGQPADPASFYQPNDVITYPNGDILVAEGHGNAAPAPARLIRFDKSGKFLREFGKMGTGPEGEFMQPHGLAFDSRGRLFVADRSNNRIQILDAETYKTLDTWYQFSRLSGIYHRQERHRSTAPTPSRAR